MLMFVCSLAVSIDAYRTQRQSKLPIVQSVTPGVQRPAQETPKPQPPVNIKEKIAVCSLLFDLFRKTLILLKAKLNIVQQLTCPEVYTGSNRNVKSFSISTTGARLNQRIEQ